MMFGNVYKKYIKKIKNALAFPKGFKQKLKAIKFSNF